MTNTFDPTAVDSKGNLIAGKMSNVGYDPSLLVSSATGTAGSPISALPAGSKVLDLIAAENGVVPFRRAASTAFWGINLASHGVPVALNSDSYGLVFITRPRLNLSYNNIVRDRPLTAMLSKDPANMFRAIRAILDPVGSSPYGREGMNKQYTRRSGAGDKTAPSIREGMGDGTSYPSNMVDPENAFIAIAGNCMTNMSGWIDPVTDTYTSKEGRYREQWGMADGFSDIYTAWPMTTTFRNMPGSPLMYLFYYWGRYQTLIKEGKLDPYPEHILENEIDYQSRAYRLVLDSTRQFVTQIGCTGACHPTSNNMGSFFNYSNDKPHNPDMDDISINWQAYGACYADPIIVDEFNAVVQMFAPSMQDGARGSNWMQVPMNARMFMNYKAKPRINPGTMELEWWVPKAIWQQFLTDVAGL